MQGNPKLSHHHKQHFLKEKEKENRTVPTDKNIECTPHITLCDA